MRMIGPAVAAALPLFGCGDDAETTAPPTTPGIADVLRLEHVQMLGTHNSYHVEAEDNQVDLFAYTHAPLAVQLEEQGVRQFEIDLHDTDGDLVFEVFHETFDTETNCATLAACLGELETWSTANPAHHPIVVIFEVKADPADLAEAAAVVDALDEQVLAVWPRERIVTPELVQGSEAGVGAAIRARGWPLVRDVRGRILFLLHETNELRDAYTHDGADLEGRVMFAQAEDAGAPYASVFVVNDPEADAAEIATLVADGFLVRTRADADNQEPLAGETARRDAALASGAHLISTDYPVPVDGVDYVATIPGGTPSRCNRVTAPPGCTSADVESLDP